MGNSFLSYAVKPDWAGIWERGIRNAWGNDMISRHGSINKAWDSYAREYENGEIKYSNRAQLVEKIAKCKPKSVLDVGAGTGVFAIPLAKFVKKVVVVEPSAGMLKILQKKAKKEKLCNIEILCKKWEDTSKEELLKHCSGGFDLVLVSHSLYYIRDLHHSFKKMDEISKRFVYLFTGCSGHSRDETYQNMYLKLHKKPLPPYPDYSCLYMVLREIGIQPDIEMVVARAKKPIKSVDEVVDNWRKHLKIKKLSKDQKDAINEYLADKIKKENGKLYHSYEYKNALIYWKVEKNGI